MTTRTQRLITLTALLTIATCIGCGEKQLPYGSPPATESPSGTVSFEEHFEPVRTVQLSDAILMGSIRHLDVGPEGRFLISERNQRATLWTPDGELIRELAAEPCDPGFDFRAGIGRFDPSGGMVVQSMGERAYRFDRQGGCVGPLSDSTTVGGPRWFGFDSTGRIYGFYAASGEEGIGYHLRQLNGDGREIHRFGGAQMFDQFIGTRWNGGLVTDQRGHVYLALPTFPYVFKFDTSGAFEETIGWKPSNFQQMETDISETNEVSDIRAQMDGRSQRSSMVQNFLRLDSDKLLVTYHNEYKAEENPEEVWTIAVMNTEGQPLLEGAMVTDLVFDAAHRGRTYAVVEPDTLADGTIPNPQIEVYRFRD